MTANSIDANKSDQHISGAVVSSDLQDDAMVSRKSYQDLEAVNARLAKALMRTEQDLLDAEDKAEALRMKMHQAQRQVDEMKRTAPDHKYRVQVKRVWSQTAILGASGVQDENAEVRELMSQGYHIVDICTSNHWNPQQGNMVHVCVWTLKRTLDPEPVGPPPPAPNDTPYVADESEGVEEEPEHLETEELAAEVSEPAARRVTGIIHLQGEPEQMSALERAFEQPNVSAAELSRLANEELVENLRNFQYEPDTSVPFNVVLMRHAERLMEIIGGEQIDHDYLHAG